MTFKTTNRDEQAKEITVRLLSELFCGERLPQVRVRLWDGATWPENRFAAATS